MIVYYIGIVMIIALDQFTKYLTVHNIALHESVEVIPGILSFTYHRNTGAAWSILEGQMWFFYIITLVAVGMMGYFLHTEGKKHPLSALALTLLIGGALGNFIDRVLHQFVIDMVQTDFISFPIFNIADMALTCGVIIMILYLIWDEFIQKKAADK